MGTSNVQIAVEAEARQDVASNVDNKATWHGVAPNYNNQRPQLLSNPLNRLMLD